MHSFTFLCEQRPNWTCSTFPIPTRYWNQLQRYLNTKIIHEIEVLSFHGISIWHHLWNGIPMCNNTPLILASLNGHVQIVQLLLSQPGIDINCKDIWIQKSFIIFKYTYLMRFQIHIFCGIEFQYLIILLSIVLQKMDISKLFNLFYHNQVLKSTTKTFKYQNYSQNINFLISSYFTCKWFITLNYTSWFFSFGYCFSQRSYRNRSTFTITTRHWNQLQKHLNTKIIHDI